MSERNHSEKPEVYALRNDSGSWQISRRDFLKAAGIGAAAIGAGLNSGCSPEKEKTLDDVCPGTLAHRQEIYHMLTSPDRDILLSVARHTTDRVHGLLKCWDFSTRELLSSLEIDNYDSVCTGMINGTPSFAFSNRKDEIAYYELPLQDVQKKKIISIPDVILFTIDPEENLYTVNSSGAVELFRKQDTYQSSRILYEAPQGMSVSCIKLFDHEKRLFFSFEPDKGTVSDITFAVLDLESRDIREYDEKFSAFDLLPDSDRMLICRENKYRLVSLTDGELWSAAYEYPSADSRWAEPTFDAAAITPDGSSAVLIFCRAGNYSVHLISMMDGTILESYEIKGIPAKTTLDLALNGDGTILAVAKQSTLMFFTLPNLQLIGCPFDLYNTEIRGQGVEISMTDEVTGETYTNTLPCGAPIPAGAVCTCNCVAAGGGDICTSYGACSCNSHGKSNGSSGSHYWHPN